MSGKHNETQRLIQACKNWITFGSQIASMIKTNLNFFFCECAMKQVNLENWHFSSFIKN